MGKGSGSRGEKKGSKVGKRQSRDFRGTEGQMMGAGGGAFLPHLVGRFCCEGQDCVAEEVAGEEGAVCGEQSG